MDSKKIDIKSHTYFLFLFLMTCQYEKLDLDKTKIDEKSCKTFLSIKLGMWRSKNLSYAKINTVIPLGFIIDKINEYIEESSGFSSYLQNERNTEKYEELPNKTRDLIRLMINS